MLKHTRRDLLDFRDSFIRNVGAGVVAGFFVSVPAFGQPGGIIRCESGTPDMCPAYAGAGTRASDASFAFADHTSMSRFKGRHLLIGSFLMLLMFNLEVEEAETTISGGFGPIIDGDELDKSVRDQIDLDRSLPEFSLTASFKD